MAYADPAVCASYITSAGMNCITHMTNGMVPAQAMVSHNGTMQSFADGLSPTICEFVNNFIGNVTGMWTDTISAAQTIISAIKKALSNPKKIKQAIKKMLALAKQLLTRVKDVITFITTIRQRMENFALSEFNQAVNSFKTQVQALEAQLRAQCETKKEDILARLNAKLASATHPGRIARLQAGIAKVQSENCDNLASIVEIDLGTWVVPNLVFGLKQIIEGFLSGLKVPALVHRQAFVVSGAVTEPKDGVKAKVERVQALVNSKIDMLQKTIEPYIKAFNVIMDLIKKLQSLSLKGVLKWLLQLPKKIIKTWVDHAKFAVNLFKSIIQQNLAVLETWLEERYQAQIAAIKDKAQALGQPYINNARELNEELNGLLDAFKRGANIREYIMSRVAQVGPVFGFVIELLMKIYGGLMGSMSYVIQIITSSIAPLLSLIGLGKAMFAAGAPNNPAVVGATQISAQEATTEYDELMYQKDGSGNLVQLGYDNEHGVFVPIDESGFALTYIEESGLYPSPPSTRPFIPYGYFDMVEVSGEYPRVNAEDTPNQILPLTDPAVLDKMNEADITEWRLLSRTLPVQTFSTSFQPTIGEYVQGIRRYEPFESLEFIQVPYYGIQPQDAEDSLNMDEYKVSGQSLGDVTSDLSAPSETPEPSKLFQGRFYYKRWVWIYEEYGMFGNHNNMRRPAVPSTYVELDRTEGYYNYSSMDNVIQYRISTHTHYVGSSIVDVPNELMVPDLPVPLTSDAFSLFYVHTSGWDSGYYDNMGKLVIVNGSYRWSLFDNSLATPGADRPEDNTHRWNVTLQEQQFGPPLQIPYTVPDVYHYNTATSGAVMHHESTKFLVANGTYLYAYRKGVLDKDFIGANLIYKKEADETYSGILAFEQEEVPYYGWSIAAIPDDAELYYVELLFANGYSGYFYDKDDPKDLTS